MVITETQKEMSSLLSTIISGTDAELKFCDLMLNHPEVIQYYDEALDTRNEIKFRQSFYSGLWLDNKKNLEEKGIDIIAKPHKMTEQEWLEHYANANYEELMKIRKQIWKPLPFWKVIWDLIKNRY